MIFSYLLNMQSHPSWVCGLKLVASSIIIVWMVSHPSWVCGLKQQNGLGMVAEDIVTPFVGVWIETMIPSLLGGFERSHPSWVCGLKHNLCHRLKCKHESHPSWVCGLKLCKAGNTALISCHTLRGCVD